MAETDPQWLDRMYNNRALVPEHARHFTAWAADSAQVRKEAKCTLDVRYGNAAGETLDVFPAAHADAPVLVFIHGGYWRSLDKSEHSFIAPAFTSEGATVVVPNYDLCPAVTVPQIAMQMVAALVWTFRNVAQHRGDPRRITIAGHSAGGHLAAMLLACDWKKYSRDLPADLVTRALSISGLYDLEPIRRTPFLRDSLRLTQDDARKASPARMPAPRGRTLYSVAGGDESAEFIRHNRLIRDAWGPQVVPECEELEGLNHFSVLESLVQPGTRLNDLALDLLVR